MPADAATSAWGIVTQWHGRLSIYGTKKTF